MHEMRTRSIQGTNLILDQNKPKIQNSTKCSKHNHHTNHEKFSRYQS